MGQQKPRRKRGVILTAKGLHKLFEARQLQEIEKNYGYRYTLEELSDRTGLVPMTITKVLNCKGGVDKQTLLQLFKAFGLELRKSDYTFPTPALVNSKSEIPRGTDWGDAIDVSVFYGRSNELQTLQDWIVNDRSRLVAIYGIGGIGKTALCVKLAQRLQGQFEFVIWRSLRNSPPVEEILTNSTQFFANGQEINLPGSFFNRLSLLLTYLKAHRCLLILDGVETILQAGEPLGQYREGYEGYSELFRLVGEISHQSCLLLTSREKPKEIISLGGASLPVRSLQLLGLKTAEVKAILRSKGIFNATDAECLQLIQSYGGNPQALKIVATSIQDLFSGNVSEFLAQDITVFGDIQELLDQQFNRLSLLEKEIMYCLAINQNPVKLKQFSKNIISPKKLPQLLGAVESLRRRSLLENNAGFFSLKPALKEYVNQKRLIEGVGEEANELVIGDWGLATGDWR